MAPLVYLVGAASSGFGKGMALEALKRGHKVIATARDSTKISDLREKGAITLDLDVTQPLEELQAIVAEAHKHYGKFDEATPEETYESFNVNVFGVINLIRAVLPYMRQQKSGTIAHFGSIGSWRGVPGAKVAPLGIDVISIEPGYFRTGFFNSGARQSTSTRIQDYEDTVFGQARKNLESKDNTQLGNTELGCSAIADVLEKHDGKAVRPRPALGSDAYSIIRAKCEDTLQLLDEWKEVSMSTDRAGS
ncbi:hypothetical protein CERZMDRAFT_113012 [Cercospora zeae-maydis SCOH1-5]|uniref:NAD(P)-binding domain-containing protein n=1 Tax=Cercospora zeae-maydis SCOH1-5 TaxID=717836 RepID=A0A6A6FBV0_9PEZI|nr:hypothetical protein CERZMDRAFT_113012 [Cercospora zeae-maydis SCOH1-5]